MEKITHIAFVIILIIIILMSIDIKLYAIENTLEEENNLKETQVAPAVKSESDQPMEKCELVESQEKSPEIFENLNFEDIKDNNYKTYEKIYNIDLSGELQKYTIEICERYGVNPIMVFAIMGCESEYQDDIISKTNDYGLMQINQCNHNSLKQILDIEDFLDAKSNILAGVYMLSTLINQFDSIEEQLMCYNLGVSGAKKYWEQGIYSNTYTKKVIERMEKIT